MASGNLYRLLAILAMMIIVASSYSRATQIQKNHLIGAALIVFYMVAIAFIVGESYTYRIGVIIHIV